MSRAEYRRTKHQKTPTYNLTREQIERIKHEATEQAAVEATILMMGIPCLVLRDLEGYGRKRFERFMDKSLFWLKSVHDGEVTLTEILKTIEDETGYSVTEQGRITKT